MRLEPFGKFTMRYARASWHRPYGGKEGLGYGDGDGELTGEITGSLTWANYPRRREDGVWMPNVRGQIHTADGADILMSVHGQSVAERAAGQKRALLVRIELTTEAPAYRWLNTCFLVGEGEIDEELDDAWIAAFVCINDGAAGPPAVGDAPPERFRKQYPDEGATL